MNIKHFMYYIQQLTSGYNYAFYKNKILTLIPSVVNYKYNNATF